MNRVESKVITDLEVLDKVFPAIDNTVTIYGKSKLTELCQTMFTHPALLERRHNILESIIFSPKNKIGISKELKKIKKTEDDISWFFRENSQEYEDLCFSRDWMNNKDVLTVRNFLKVYLPSILLLVYLLIYIVIRYCGVQISVKEYLKGIYYGYKAFISGVLGLIIGFGNMNSFLTNVLATLYLIYQVYIVYNNIDSSLSHRRKCSEFSDRFKKIRKTIDCIKKVTRLDKFLTNEQAKIGPMLQQIDELLSPKNTKSMGYCILLKKNSTKHEEVFEAVLQYVGLIDALISISKLVTNYGYVFPTYDLENDKPYVDAVGLRCPFMNPAMQVTNNCHLGEPNTLIITGPNTSGKSTYIRNLMLSVLMAQTLGVCCCTDIVFTPFQNIFTYIDIPNVSRIKESLFEAEVMRCLEFCHMLEQMPPNNFVLTVMDELFTGTNPREGVAGSYAVCDYVGDFPNSLLVVTTHFTELTSLEAEKPDKYKNMKFYLDRNEDGSFIRTYKIAEGISDQNIAIELLYRKGYSSKIIDKALDYLEKIS